MLLLRHDRMINCVIDVLHEGGTAMRLLPIRDRFSYLRYSLGNLPLGGEGYSRGQTSRERQAD